MKGFIIFSLFVGSAVGGAYALFYQAAHHDDDPLSYEEISDILQLKAGADLAARWGVFNGYTGGATFDGIRKVILGFQSGTAFDGQRGRMVVLDAIRHLIQVYQANEEIQQYIVDGPFCERHVEASLHGPWWTEERPRCVSTGWIYNQMTLKYDISEGLNPSRRENEALNETLDEAIQQVVNAKLVKGWWQDKTGKRWPLFEESLAKSS